MSATPWQDEDGATAVSPHTEIVPPDVKTPMAGAPDPEIEAALEKQWADPAPGSLGR